MKKADVPLYFALIFLVAGILISWFYLRGRGDAAVVFGLVVTNSLAQAALDFYKGSGKPTLSALARVVPIVAGAFAFFK